MYYLFMNKKPIHRFAVKVHCGIDITKNELDSIDKDCDMPILGITLKSHTILSLPFTIQTLLLLFFLKLFYPIVMFHVIGICYQGCPKREKKVDQSLSITLGKEWLKSLLECVCMNFVRHFKSYNWSSTG